MKRLVHLCSRKSWIDWRRRANKGGRGWIGLDWNGERLDWMWATRAVLLERSPAKLQAHTKPLSRAAAGTQTRCNAFSALPGRLSK